jgi:hypothetical protein
MFIGGGGMVLGSSGCKKTTKPRKKVVEARSTVYRGVNGSPGQNLSKLIQMMGGVSTIFGVEDVVVIKPNAQWWNQGAPNLSALKTFAELVMERPGGFQGEVVLAENIHRGASPGENAYSGWVPRFKRNSDIDGINNLNELAAHLKTKYGDKFSVCHLIDVEDGGRRIFGPSDGTGYVYCDGTDSVPLVSFSNGCRGNDHREVIMTYPIMQTDRGTVIDFKNGIWEKGAYTGQPLKFVNLASLNHHSGYCGATSAIKNYLGVTDMSGGHGGRGPHDDGKLTKEYYNFHAFPFNEWKPGPVPGMIGAEIGVFMSKIRKADLNITTAEWVGLASRTDPPVAHTRAVLASTDPVALDYHAFKYVLFPNSRVPVHDPDNPKSPVHQYLRKCEEQGGGVFDEEHVSVESYDFVAKRSQRDDELMIAADKEWGGKPKIILKYLALRHFIR